MSADVDQLQRKWKELVAGNRMRCSFPAFNWNKDGVQFEAGNPLSSSSGAHFYQARLIKKKKKKNRHMKLEIVQSTIKDKSELPPS